MIKGGRWIANFSVAIRDFLLSQAIKEVDQEKQSHKTKFDTLIYGGVRSGGFLLSKAFAFMASPTYKVGCAVIHIQNPPRTKWSAIVQYLRESYYVKDSMEFEWMWIVFYGQGEVLPRVAENIKRHASREVGLLYSDLKKKTIINSDSFISRRGAKLFDPANLDKNWSRYKTL